ncbi:hypothetical protein D3C85_1168610 [compost metagenome]
MPWWPTRFAGLPRARRPRRAKSARWWPISSNVRHRWWSRSANCPATSTPASSRSSARGSIWRTLPVWRPVSSPRSGKSPRAQTPTVNNSTACFTPSSRCAATWRSATSRLSTWPRRRCKWKGRPKPSASDWPRWGWMITTSGSMTWPGKARAGLQSVSRRISMPVESAWTICSTATTRSSPIPARPSTRRVSTATPIRCCQRSRNPCCRVTKDWCSPSPAPSRVMCRPTTMRSASR